MKLFLDSAKLDEIKHALEMWDLDGLTTNPRHIEQSGKPFRRVIEEIARLFEGTAKPVSVEVNPHLTDWQAIVAAGTELAHMSPNFVIKVGAGESGFRALRELASRGVRTNATLVFSAAQAWHAMRCGVTYVSPFVGWKEAHGDDASSLVGELVRIRDNYSYPTLVLAAAMRNSRQLVEAALTGADCATAAMSVYQESFSHPYTDAGSELFARAWDATPRE